MVFGLTDKGEELFLREVFKGEDVMPASVKVFLYNDRDFYVQDTLVYDNVDSRDDTTKGEIFEESDDIGSIETEPQGSAYGRQSLSVGGDFTLSDPGNWTVTYSDVVFDVSDSTQTVTAMGIIVEFQSQDAGDSSANAHIITTNKFTTERDLSLEDGELTFTRANLSIT